MKKTISKLLTILMVVSSIIFVSACGGNDVAKSPYEGRWIAVVAEMFGIQTSVEEAVGGEFAFEFNGGGKGKMSQGDDSFKIKWSSEEENIVVNIDGEEMIGKIVDTNTIVFEDMLGMGVNMTFGREGTDAADPSNYMSEDEEKVVGGWQAESVTDVLGDSVTLEAVSDIHDAMRLEFAKDHTVEVTYKGESIGSFTWDVSFEYVSIETGEDFSIYVTMNEDGTMSVDYSDDNDYYTFEMVKF